MDNKFKIRLRQAIDESGLSQAEVARRAGIGRNSITAYLKGRYLAKQQYLGALARVLNVNEGWLMGVSDDKVREDTVDEFVNGLRSYQGKPVSDEQREYIRKSVKEFLNMTTNNNNSEK